MGLKANKEKLTQKNEFLTWPNMTLTNMDLRPIWSPKKRENRKRRRGRGRGRGREEEDEGEKFKQIQIKVWKLILIMELNGSMEL